MLTKSVPALVPDPWHRPGWLSESLLLLLFASYVGYRLSHGDFVLLFPICFTHSTELIYEDGRVRQFLKFCTAHPSMCIVLLRLTRRAVKIQALVWWIQYFEWTDVTKAPSIVLTSTEVEIFDQLYNLGIWVLLRFNPIAVAMNTNHPLL